jgi:N-acetyl-alpha-D-glucosaminyl L-malate synthase BshA
VKVGITCYPTYGGPGFVPRVTFHEVSLGHYPLFQYPPYDLALAVKMHEVAQQRDLDLLHVHYAIPHATSAWLAKQMLLESGKNLPVVTTLHGTDITIVGQDHSYHAITKFSIEKSDRVTAVSQFLKDETVRSFGCGNDRVAVIPNFVDSAVYSPARRDETVRRELAGNAAVLMHVSNFRPVKRVLDVIGTFAKVRAVTPAVLVMAGDGPDRAAAEDEARKLGVFEDVRFLGRIDAIAPLLALADVYLLTTDRESFGLSALEAMASGVPVVAAGVGGITEVVEDGVTGALCPVGDTTQMAAASLRLIQDKALWKKQSAAAVARANAKFGMVDIVSRYEAVYKTLL